MRIRRAPRVPAVLPGRVGRQRVEPEAPRQPAARGAPRQRAAREAPQRQVEQERQEAPLVRPPWAARRARRAPAGPFRKLAPTPRTMSKPKWVPCLPATSFSPLPASPTRNASRTVVVRTWARSSIRFLAACLARAARVRLGTPARAKTIARAACALAARVPPCARSPVPRKTTALLA